MIEIIGNFNTARVFATTLEDGARANQDGV